MRCQVDGGFIADPRLEPPIRPLRRLVRLERDREDRRRLQPSSVLLLLLLALFVVQRTSDDDAQARKVGARERQLAGRKVVRLRGEARAAQGLRVCIPSLDVRDASAWENEGGESDRGARRSGRRDRGRARRDRQTACQKTPARGARRTSRRGRGRRRRARTRGPRGSGRRWRSTTGSTRLWGRAGWTRKRTSRSTRRGGRASRRGGRVTGACRAVGVAGRFKLADRRHRVQNICTWAGSLVFLSRRPRTGRLSAVRLT